MEPQDDRMRDGLLSQLSQPANLADYRKEVADALETNRKSLLREKRSVTALWIFCVASSIAFLWFDGAQSVTPKGPWLGLFMFLVGMVELLKHHTNRCRVDVLKEIKQVQVQVFELQNKVMALAREQPPPE